MEERDAAQDALADHVWSRTKRPLLVAQRAARERISSGIAILPTSCSTAANSRSRRSPRQAELAADGDGQARRGAGVLLRLQVLGLERVRERRHGRQVGALDLGVQPRAPQHAAGVAGEGLERAEDGGIGRVGGHEQQRVGAVVAGDRLERAAAGRAARLAPGRAGRAARAGRRRRARRARAAALQQAVSTTPSSGASGPGRRRPTPAGERVAQVAGGGDEARAAGRRPAARRRTRRRPRRPRPRPCGAWRSRCRPRRRSRWRRGPAAARAPAPGRARGARRASRARARASARPGEERVRRRRRTARRGGRRSGRPGRACRRPAARQHGSHALRAQVGIATPRATRSRRSAACRRRERGRLDQRVGGDRDVAGVRLARLDAVGVAARGRRAGARTHSQAPSRPDQPASRWRRRGRSARRSPGRRRGPRSGDSASGRLRRKPWSSVSPETAWRA